MRRAHQTVTEQTMIVIADDDGDMRSMLSRKLRKEGFDVRLATDGTSLKELLCSLARPPAVVISDINMPQTNGFEVLRWTKTHLPSTQVILITGFGDASTHRRARELGATAVFDKPFSLNRLHEAVVSVLGTSDL